MSAKSWGAGLAIGMILAFGRAIVEYTAAGTFDAGQFALMIGFGVGLAPALEWLTFTTIDVMVKVAEALPKSEPERYEPEPAPQPAPTMRPVSGTVNGRWVENRFEMYETKTPRWHEWQRACWHFVGWYELRHSLIADVLSPGAFADRAAWVEFTNALRDLGLVIKDRTGTTWRHPLGAVKAQLERGLIDWPEHKPPPKIAPAPPRPVIVEAQAREGEPNPNAA